MYVIWAHMLSENAEEDKRSEQKKITSKSLWSEGGVLYLYNILYTIGNISKHITLMGQIL